MLVLASLAEWSVAAFAVVLFIAQFIAQELGQWVGRFERRRVDGKVEGVGVVVGGMLALLAFVLALTLSFANGRFTERRAGSLQEANAIGTAWLRAEAIPDPRGREIAQLLKDYTTLRIEFIHAGRDQNLIDDLNKRASAMQSKMWASMTGILHDHPGPIAVSLQAALNDVFDMGTAERFAYAFKLPAPLFWLLIGLALLSMAALGYQLGLSGKPLRLLVVLLTIMLTLVMVDILDLAAPRLGEFRTSAAAYEWTLAGFNGGATVPPSQ